MPCYSPPPTKEELNRYGNLTDSQAEAVLCGVFRVIEGRESLYNFLNEIDFEEVGVPRSLVATWWKKHKAEDELRSQQKEESDQMHEADEIKELARLKAKYEPY